MDPVEKNMIVGAFLTAGVDMGLEAWWAYNNGIGKPITGFPYVSVGTDYLPSADDWIASAGTPLLLYVLGKGMKKDSLVHMSKGGAIYGVSQLAGLTLYRTVNKVAPASYTYVLTSRRL